MNQEEQKRLIDILKNESKATPSLHQGRASKNIAKRLTGLSSFTSSALHGAASCFMPWRDVQTAIMRS